LCFADYLAETAARSTSGEGSEPEPAPNENDAHGGSSVDAGKKQQHPACARFDFDFADFELSSEVSFTHSLR
jgi:hypothetical protein